MTTNDPTAVAEDRPSLYTGPRGIAVKILNRIGRSDAYLDRLLDHELRSEDLNELDKGLMNEIVTGVVRWQMKLDWVLTGFFHGNFTKAETNIRNALRVALYQILFLDRVPHSAAVNEAVEFMKRIRGQKAADLVNAVLRNIIRNLENIRYPDANEDRIRHLSVVESHPYWMTRRWVDRFGYDEARRLMAANNRIPELSLRINRLKTDIQSFHRLLTQHNVAFTASRFLDCFIRVPHMSNIGGSDMFRQGYISVQDESAGLAVQLLDPKPGERILDLCAAPGGKTIFMAELMNNDGEVVAVDRYETRLNLVKAAAQRTGVSIVQLVSGDAAEIDLPPGDRVLVDAPCSGLGVLAKKPDAKWHRQIEDIERLGATQQAILKNAARLVKPGGVLVYSTCTIEPEENRMVIDAFLKEHPDFTLEPAPALVHRDVVSAAGTIETFTHRHGTDGSFAARLRRSGH
jgi:16S rRNA (cytosine967-C5)-methyltransferase